MGHQGSYKRKIQAIEAIDKEVVGYLMNRFAETGTDYRMMILPDHPTPVCKRTHTGNPIPYLLYDSTHELIGNQAYNEASAKASGVFCEVGHELMDHLLNG